MDWDNLVYVMVFLVLAFLPGVKKQQAAKPKTQNTEDDARYLEEARKKIEMLKRQRRTGEPAVQTQAPQAKSTIENPLRIPPVSHLEPPVDVVRSEIERPYVCVKCALQPKFQTRVKKSTRLRQWIIGQVVLARKFSTHY
jgi:hypothetical protein